MTHFCECHDFDCGLAAAEAYLQARVRNVLDMLHWDQVYNAETSNWYRPLNCTNLAFSNSYAQNDIEGDYWGRIREVPSMQFLRNIVHVREMSFPAEMRQIAHRRQQLRVFNHLTPPRSLLAVEIMIQELPPPANSGWGLMPPPDSDAGESNVSAASPTDAMSAVPAD
jgi:hypothetical protein